MMDELKDSNQLSETLLIITSDHGHSDTSNHIEIVDILTDAGYKVFSYPLIYKKYSEDVDAAVMVSGNSMSHIYLRKDGNWEKNFSFKDSEILIEKLLSFEGIDIVMAKNEKGQIVIRSKRGIALLEDKETGVFYTPLLNDPFGFTGIEDYISYDEVLDLTFDTKYPDSLTQIAQIFKSSRCGDIVISAESGYDLRKDFEVPEHKSSHGSLNSEHMHVPLVMNKKVTESKIRTVDLYPTILDYLGFPCPSKIDGKKLDIN
jgi:arylsulfatase A-like enzyme